MTLLFIYVTPIIYDLQYVILFWSAVSDSISMCIHVYFINSLSVTLNLEIK